MSVIVTIACLFGVYLLAQGLPQKPQPEVLPEGVEVLKITATNYEFNQKEYHVKAGTTYRISFSNAVGLHGFSVEGLDLKMSKDNPTVEYTFTQPGEYKMYCDIMCGIGHNDMVAKIIVS
jgi:cytochrome c oxidase subunit 2